MSTKMMAAPARATSALSESSLTQQLEHEDGSTTPKTNKLRSLSEFPPKPSLSPSPAIREANRRVSKDDSATLADPITPKRPSYHTRGLSLQMPATDKENQEASNPATARIPLSPKLDSSSIYGSPASVLPRRSRGLDFARACTNLHHSTLAESSPDASPITGRGINIPQRRGIGSSGTILESPSQVPLWSSVNAERTALSGSVSSINMMDSDSDSDNSSEDMAMDRDMDDPMLNTPAASKINGLVMTNSPGMEWLNQPAASQSSLLAFQPHRMNFRRTRLRHAKSSQSSSSVSMRSSKHSPGPLSPPLRPSVEGSGYFGMTKQQVRSRRESLSLGTDDLQLSDSDWETESKMNGRINSSTADASSERGVVKRAVTRRSNLLPKTKGFARIRAALMEESDPLHSDARREAEVIKQVHESDDVYPSKSDNALEAAATTEPVEASIESVNGNELSGDTSNESPDHELTTEPFSTHAKRNSGGLGFWNAFEHTPPKNIDRYRTPPPPSLYPQDSAASDDAMTSTTTPFYESSQTGSLIRHLHRSRSRSTTPLASAAAAQATANVYGNVNNNQPPTAGDVARKMNNKRRRDDDFDLASFKRRAVSPSMVGSAQSSPVVPQSPTMNNDKSWGRPPSKSQADRSNSNGSTGANGPKRVGLQGMTEASDGFMTMSID